MILLRLLFAALALHNLAAACDTPGCNEPAAQNVNSRYTIESVAVKPECRRKLTSALREDLDRLVGEKVDQARIEDMSRRLRTELHADEVRHKLEKGEKPEHVKLMFEAERRHMEEEPKVTKLAYHSKQGWTGGLNIDTRIQDAGLEFGIQSDGDELLERYAGLNAGARITFHERVRLRFQFEAFHQQWNRGTLEALQSEAPERTADTPGIYRERFNYQPTITIVLARPLTLTAGLSLQQFQTQYPAAHFEAANAAIGTLRFRQVWRRTDDLRHELDASYALRAANNTLGTDYVYARHQWRGRYTYTLNEHEMILAFLTGTMSGRAPLFERFVLGNTSTLRGWHKYDLAPLGGSRVWHTTAEYRVHGVQIFYDAGSVWDDGEAAVTRHALGFGFAEGNFALSVGFPLKSGRATPVFLLALRF